MFFGQIRTLELRNSDCWAPDWDIAGQAPNEKPCIICRPPRRRPTCVSLDPQLSWDINACGKPFRCIGGNEAGRRMLVRLVTIFAGWRQRCGGQATVMSDRVIRTAESSF
jgi:hypothetical protein